MSGGIGTFIVGLAGPVVRKALISLGLGVASYAAIATALTAAIGAAKSAFSGFTGDSLSIVQLSGATDAIGIICGALTARVALMAVKKLEILK